MDLLESETLHSIIAEIKGNGLSNDAVVRQPFFVNVYERFQDEVFFKEFFRSAMKWIFSLPLSFLPSWLHSFSVWTILFVLLHIVLSIGNSSFLFFPIWELWKACRCPAYVETSGSAFHPRPFHPCPAYGRTFADLGLWWNNHHSRYLRRPFPDRFLFTVRVWEFLEVIFSTMMAEVVRWSTRNSTKISS